MSAGMIYMFAGNSAPSGYLMCDGSAVSREDYSLLFAVIGTAFGNGDGSTTFNLPDLSGRVAMGASQSHAQGSTGGTETCTLTVDNLPSHLHEVPQHGHGSSILATTPSLSHSVTQPAFTYTPPNNPSSIRNTSDGNSARSGTTSTNASLSTAFTVSDHSSETCTMSGSISDCDTFDSGSAGSSAPHDNMQPYITMHYVISTGG